MNNTNNTEPRNTAGNLAYSARIAASLSERFAQGAEASHNVYTTQEQEEFSSACRRTLQALETFSEGDTSHEATVLASAQLAHAASLLLKLARQPITVNREIGSVWDTLCDLDSSARRVSSRILSEGR